MDSVIEWLTASTLLEGNPTLKWLFTVVTKPTKPKDADDE